MPNSLRHMLACLLLVAVAVTGRFSPCCSLMTAPLTACVDHDHHAPGDEGEQDHGCPCSTCHEQACSHVLFHVEPITVMAVRTRCVQTLRGAGDVPVPSSPAAEIFTPPKLG